jgi:hypothetical protein
MVVWLAPLPPFSDPDLCLVIELLPAFPGNVVSEGEPMTLTHLAASEAAPDRKTVAKFSDSWWYASSRRCSPEGRKTYETN